MNATNTSPERGGGEMSETGIVDYRDVPKHKIMAAREHAQEILALGIPMSAAQESCIAGLSAELQDAIQVYQRELGVRPREKGGGIAED